MQKSSTLLLAALVAGSLLTTNAFADAKKGQRYYLKKLKVCRKDGIKNGAAFSSSKSRNDWEVAKKDDELLDVWKELCPSGVKKFDKMKEKDINNLYDFCYKYASDGEVPSCGSSLIDRDILSL